MSDLIFTEDDVIVKAEGNVQKSIWLSDDAHAEVCEQVYRIVEVVFDGIDISEDDLVDITHDIVGMHLDAQTIREHAQDILEEGLVPEGT